VIVPVQKIRLFQIPSRNSLHIGVVIGVVKGAGPGERKKTKDEKKKKSIFFKI
jgi:hypothetical protein